MSTKAATPEEAAQEPWLPARSWAVPLALAVWVWAAGWAPLWLHREGVPVPGWAMAVGGLVFALVAKGRARAEFPEEWFGPGNLLRFQAGGCAWAAGAAVGAWLVFAAYSDPWRALPLLALLAAGPGAWWAGLVAEGARRARREVREEGAIAALPVPSAMRRMLDAARLGDVEILEHRETRTGHAWLLGPRTTDEEGMPLSDLADFDSFMTRAPGLRSQCAAYWRRHGVTFEDNDLRGEPIAVDRWWWHVNTKHIETEDVPASAAPAGRPWAMPQWLGLFLDAGDIDVTLCAKHVKVVGATDAGKSVVANNIIRAAVTAQTEGRRECLVWVCATSKLTPLVWPWLESYLDGTSATPVIDWVAGEDPMAVLEMLKRVYLFAKHRAGDLDEHSKVRVTPDQPGVLVVWEEAKHGGARPETIEVLGQEHTISALVNETTAMCRAAGISFLALTQQGTYDGLGPFGDEMQRNFTVRVCVATETEYDGRATLPKLEGTEVNTMVLKHNTAYLQPSLKDDARAMPCKFSHLDGSALIRPVAEAAARLPAPRLTDGELRVLGEVYANRWAPEAVPTLHRAASRRGWRWPAYGAQLVGSEREEVPEVEAAQPHEEPQEPATAPAEPGSAAGLDSPEGWDPAWDAGLAEILGQPEEDTGAVAEGPDPYGLPGEAELVALEEQAAAMAAEANATGGEDGEGLPEPLRSVEIAAGEILDAAPGREFVATAELAERVWGDGGTDSATKLGRAIGRLLPGLRTVGPKAYPGGRGRGYLVAELAEALEAVRDRA